VTDLVQLVRDLGRPTVVVFGDAMLDRYVFGGISRISPEAPIQILRVERDEERPGGAASVAADLAVLGARVRLVACAGDDEAGSAMHKLLAAAKIDAKGVVATPGRPTTLKTRMVARGTSHSVSQQVLRVDREDTGPLRPADEKRLVASLAKALRGAGALVISDYAKGVVSERTARAVIAAARKAGVPVVVDPKGRDYSRYRGATVITPNRKETLDATGIAPSGATGAEAAGRRLIELTGVDAAVITLDKDGMAIVPKDGAVEMVLTSPREVYDVTGAGDIVAAVIGLALADGRSLRDAVHLANAAAGVEVGKVGASPVSREEILIALGGEHASVHRVVDRATLKRELSVLRAAGKKVVFTNGCFDILHAGHARYLHEARRQGDVLVVGLNSDPSVRRLKGEGRPVVAESDRAELLASLDCVDYVVVFDDDTPADLIRAVEPDVLVKGEDWKDKGVVGREFVEARGGRVVLVKLLAGRSTTNVVEKIRGSGRKR
jgi:D-beta-D-heptose 7-phosphate kinase/D-beta-D-heptose 1-phosphate adenosyltransferase